MTWIYWVERHTSQTKLIVPWSTSENATRIKSLCHMWCQDEAMLLGMRYGSTGNISCMSNFEAWLLSTDARDSKWNIDNLPQPHKWWKISRRLWYNGFLNDLGWIYMGLWKIWSIFTHCIQCKIWVCIFSDKSFVYLWKIICQILVENLLSRLSLRSRQMIKKNI